MATRKTTEITDMSKLGMFDFYITAADGYDDIVRMTGDRGYPKYYAVELQFIDVEYIACPLYLSGFGGLLFRYATQQEIDTIYHNFLDFPPKVIYCFEEDFSYQKFPPDRETHKFFIVASRVEITIQYDEENIHHLETLKDIPEHSLAEQDHQEH